MTGVGGTGDLGGVSSLSATSYVNADTHCVLLSSGKVDCFGSGYDGVLGDGSLSEGPAWPVAVVAVGGSGALTGITSVVGSTGDGGFCVVTAAGGADCWGHGTNDELGDGGDQNSDSPVRVVLHS